MELFANNKFAVALGRAWPLLALLIFVVAVTLIGSLGSASLDRTVTTMVINLILVVGLYAFVGLSGVFSFGHMAFMAVGAYTMALFTIPADAKAHWRTCRASFPAPICRRSRRRSQPEARRRYSPSSLQFR
jgi:ABC-type branched-subunit amino acid transport system permease subunit